MYDLNYKFEGQHILLNRKEHRLICRLWLLVRLIYWKKSFKRKRVWHMASFWFTSLCTVWIEVKSVSVVIVVWEYTWISPVQSMSKLALHQLLFYTGREMHLVYFWICTHNRFYLRVTFVRKCLHHYQTYHWRVHQLHRSRLWGDRPGQILQIYTNITVISYILVLSRSLVLNAFIYFLYMW